MIKQKTNMPGRKACSCDIEQMQPSSRYGGEYLLLCDNCDGYITKDKNQLYNEYYEFSGYDDDPRHEWEDLHEDEYPDTH